ncbi:hypothetical protein SY89_02435 [Halolamina pelagica]|uniref:Uncharacterized protein n=1 Tax=Halolamina pelagica TaxID=699431 RepID=A0A0P7H0K0_9EURY|nr:DUF1918 domain-containing protein [Halolamina pelagica]KPN31686.1 hypothetical protein SY89_02435 [Halolamina pelagica]
MSFEKGDVVVLNDEHSEFDGEEGEITQVMETMFGDPNYTIVFEDGQEAGIPEDQLDLVAEADDEDDDADEE